MAFSLVWDLAAGERYKELEEKARRSFANRVKSKKTKGMVRIVVVMGAMVTKVRNEIAESRVRTRTGLRLSGALNVCENTSP
jgi:hypothetical protein